ncbi:MAG TPA: serine protease [Chroococcales cyanobacterium]
MAFELIDGMGSDTKHPKDHQKPAPHDSATQNLQDDSNPGPPKNLYVLKPGLPLQKDNAMQPQADDLTHKLFDQVSPAVVKVVVPDGSGSGFFFDKDGDIATDAHVVLGENQVDVITKDGKAHAAKVVKIDDVDDVAILRIDGGTPADIKVPKLVPDEELQPDDQFWAIGHPQGLDPIYISPGYYQGDVTALEVIKNEGTKALAHAEEFLENLTPKEFAEEKAALNRDLAQGKIHVEPGNSGGPVVDRDGNVVGLTDMTNGDSDTEVTPISVLTDLMAQKTPKFTMQYQFVPADKAKNKVAPNGEYILTDISRGGGDYRPPFNDPLFDGSDDTKKLINIDSHMHYVPRAHNQ